MADATTPDPAFEHRRGRHPEGRPPGLAAILTPWFAFLGGAAAWILHLTVGYSLSEIACGSERLDLTLLGLPGPEFLGYALTLLAGLTAVAAAITAFTYFPDGVRDDPVDAPGALEVLGRRRFMAYAGLIMNGIFLIAILAGGLPFMFLRTCTS